MGGEEDGKSKYRKDELLPSSQQHHDDDDVRSRRSSVAIICAVVVLTTGYLLSLSFSALEGKEGERVGVVMRHTGSSSETKLSSHQHFTANQNDIDKARADAAAAAAAPHHFIQTMAQLPATPLTAQEEEEWRRHHIESVLAKLIVSSDQDQPVAQAHEWVLTQDPRKLGKTSAEDLFLVQRFVLATLFFATNNIHDKQDATTLSWKHGDLHWLSGLHECHWNKKLDGAIFGVVQCDENQRVTHLFLPENNLQGTIPPQIGYLTHLQSLDLNGNSLHGTIPDTISLLKDLNYLGLSGNALTGNIPESFDTMDRLEQLLLHFNQMSFTIPTSVCKTRDPNHFYNTWTDCLVPQLPPPQQPDEKIKENLLSSSSNPPPPPPVVCDCCQVCCDRVQNCLPVEEINSGGNDNAPHNGGIRSTGGKGEQNDDTGKQ